MKVFPKILHLVTKKGCPWSDIRKKNVGMQPRVNIPRLNGTAISSIIKWCYQKKKTSQTYDGRKYQRIEYECC